MNNSGSSTRSSLTISAPAIPMTIQLVIPLAITMIVSAGCASKATNASPAAADSAASAAAAAPLAASPAMQAIPSDTPYAVLTLTPPPALHVDQALAAARQPIAELHAAATALRQKAELEPPERFLVALDDELGGTLDRRTLETLGFHSQPRVAVYGIGLMPAMRLEIKDGAAVESLISRLIDKSLGKALGPLANLIARSSVKGQSYWHVAIPDSGMTFVLAVADRELVAGITPSAERDAFAAALLTGPAQSMASSRRLHQMVATHRLGRHALAYVDLDRITATLFDAGTVLPPEMAEAVAALSPVCRSEIRDLARAMPRAAFGAEYVPGGDTSVALALEMAPERARELEGIESQVQGFGLRPDARDLLSLGVAVNVDKALGFLVARASAIQTAPYQCDELAGLNEAANEILANLSRSSQKIPPLARQPRGVYVAVRDGDFSAEQPTDVKAMMVLAMSDPMQLVSMARAMVPQLGEMTVAPDGEPVSLPAMGLPAEMVSSPHVAATDSSLAVSVGEGMNRELAAVLASPAPKGAPMARLAVDLGRLAGILETRDARAAEILAQYDRGEVVLDATGRGLVLRVHGHGQQLASKAGGASQLAGR